MVSPVSRRQARAVSFETEGSGIGIRLSRSVIPNPFDSRLASRGCLLETGLALLAEMLEFGTGSPNSVALIVLQVHIGSHPRMNTALEMLELVGIELGGVGAAWRHHVVGLQRGTLRSNGGVARQVIQKRDDPAAELRDAGERMNFAASIDSNEI